MTVQRMQRVHPSGFVTRATAFILDLVIVAAIATLLALALGLLLNFFQSTVLTHLWQGTAIQRLWGTIAQVVMFAFSAFFAWFYFALAWSLVGFTPGQFLAGVRVVRKNGELLSFWRALARIMLFTLSALPLGLGFFWVIIDSRRQAWHDKIVGTYVVYTDLPGNADSAYVEPAQLGRQTPAQR
jgi:uncharacterized RDD family membrane protein YckC